MTLRRQDALWKHALGDSLLGNRGLVKANMMLLPWAVMLAREGRFLRPGTAPTFFLMLLVIFAWLMTCILANDLADSRADRAAGKRRWINRLPSPARVAVTAVLVCLGPGVLILSRAPVRALLTYAGAAALGLAYSLKPLRLKGRGVWGVLGYSASCTLAYVFIPWAWLGARGRILAVMGVAVFLDKWVNLHFHQVIDLEGDRAQGVDTHAVLEGAARARQHLQYWAWLTTLWFGFVFVEATAAEPRVWRIAGLAIVVGVFVMGGLSVARLSRKLQPGSSLARELPPAYLASAFAVFRLLPLILILRFCLEAPALWPVEGAAGLLVGVESLMFFRYPS
ncbi:MAG: UbiA family prenyltransferase [Candidatus Aminicenantes bacterium]|nr:UbiA family prenyltransferase [Candidatus Aminicenantes bacterium]